MRNHWLKLREQKNHIWTAEFSKNGMYILRPRAVDVLDARGSLSSISGTARVNFRGGVTTTEPELVDFMIDSRKGMRYWLSRLRLYSGLMNELRYYELSGLKFNSIGVGLSFEDMVLSFDFDDVRVVHVI